MPSITPKIRITRKIPSAMKNSTLAMVRDPEAMFVKPNSPASSEMMKKMTAHLSTSLSASGGRLRVNGLRLLDRRAPDLLLEALALALLVGRELHRAAALGGAVQRADHAHVGQAFVGRRL